MKNITRRLTIPFLVAGMFALGSCQSSKKMDRHGIYRVSNYCRDHQIVKNHKRFHRKSCNFKDNKHPIARYGPKTFLEGNKPGRFYKH